MPCVANRASFLLDDKKFKSLVKSIIAEKRKQNNPATATVVNLGVSFLHLKLTEKIEKPRAETRPNIKPANELFSVLPSAITIIPNAATNIEIQTVIVIFSLRNRKPSNAVMKGIAARHKRVTAAVVFVIDHINVIIAVPNPTPPITPETPILR